MKAFILGLILSTLSFQGFAKTRVITLVNHQYEGVKQWLPGTIYANVGDDVELHLINKKGKHGFRIKAFNVATHVGEKMVKLKFKADKAGIHKIDCQLHGAHIGGQFIVNGK